MASGRSSPTTSTRTHRHPFDPVAYRQRNLIECKRHDIFVFAGVWR